MIEYIIKSSLCLVLVLVIYFFLLEKEKAYKFNRFYLLFGLVFSVLVPFVPITTYEEVTSTLEVVGSDFISDSSSSTMVGTLGGAVEHQQDYLIPILLIAWGIVSSFLLFRFIKNIAIILLSAYRNRRVEYQGAKLVLIKNQVMSHTFLNYIFISEDEYEKNAVEEELLKHELAHVNQRHTLDILLIEWLHIFLWFNPILIFYKKAIQLNHEFLADDAVLSVYKNVSDYQTLLLSKIGCVGSIPLTNSFNYLITKKRLIMMTKHVNKTRVLLKKVALLPLLGVSVFLFSTKVVAQKNHTDSKVGKTYADSKVGKVTDSVSVKQFTAVEVSPSFPGGMEEFMKFISLHTPLDGTSGKTDVVFYVDKDGTVETPEISAGSESINQKALFTSIAKSPKWRPAIQNGKSLKVGYVMSVSFLNGDVIRVDEVKMIEKELFVTFVKSNKNGGADIQGVVLDRDGKPVVGASVRSRDYKTGVASNESGVFSIVLPESKPLDISSIGYVTKRINP